MVTVYIAVGNNVSTCIVNCVSRYCFATAYRCVHNSHGRLHCAAVCQGYACISYELILGGFCILTVYRAFGGDHAGNCSSRLGDIERHDSRYAILIVIAIVVHVRLNVVCAVCKACFGCNLDRIMSFRIGEESILNFAEGCLRAKYACINSIAVSPGLIAGGICCKSVFRLSDSYGELNLAVIVVAGSINITVNYSISSNVGDLVNLFSVKSDRRSKSQVNVYATCNDICKCISKKSIGDIVSVGNVTLNTDASLLNGVRKYAGDAGFPNDIGIPNIVFICKSEGYLICSCRGA